MDEAALCQRAEDLKNGFVSQQSRARQEAERACQRDANEARKQAAETRKQELHKWRVLRTQAEVDHRILLNMNLETPEHRITVGPQHIIAAEKAA